MTNRAHILVIDDESQIRKLLEITLESHGYQVHFALNGKEGIQLAANRPPDLILLDLGLPDLDGQQVLRALRQWYSKPIIILSVRNAEDDIVTALDHGANDFLNKPFRAQELLARIRSALRVQLPSVNDPVFRLGNLDIDLAARSVKKNGQLLKLTATEYNLLALLVKNEGRVLTHQYLLREIWGPSYADQTQYLRVFVAQLRKKIEDDANRPKYLLTESGIGYRFQSG
ncbi:Stage 0 sporulation A-like protein [Flavobacterium longum]|uniref:response regulator n=1 Tax=Flavobacterium longum TaxID=1299340 RepID=UPI0039E9F9F7